MVKVEHLGKTDGWLWGQSWWKGRGSEREPSPRFPGQHIGALFGCCWGHIKIHQQACWQRKRHFSTLFTIIQLPDGGKKTWPSGDEQITARRVWDFCCGGKKKEKARFDRAWRLRAILVLMDTYFIHNELERCQNKEKRREELEQTAGRKWRRVKGCSQRWKCWPGTPKSCQEENGRVMPLWQLYAPGFPEMLTSFNPKSSKSRTDF